MKKFYSTAIWTVCLTTAIIGKFVQTAIGCATNGLFIHQYILNTFCFSESKAANDFFKTELNYDAEADPANFVQDIFHEEETISQVPENDSHMADTMEQDNENGEIGTSANIEHSDKPLDKPQAGDVRIFSVYLFGFF